MHNMVVVLLCILPRCFYNVNLHLNKFYLILYYLNLPASSIIDEKYLKLMTWRFLCFNTFDVADQHDECDLRGISYWKK